MRISGDELVALYSSKEGIALSWLSCGRVNASHTVVWMLKGCSGELSSPTRASALTDFSANDRPVIGMLAAHNPIYNGYYTQ